MPTSLSTSARRRGVGVERIVTLPSSNLEWKRSRIWRSAGGDPSFMAAMTAIGWTSGARRRHAWSGIPHSVAVAAVTLASAHWPVHRSVLLIRALASLCTGAARAVAAQLVRSSDRHDEAHGHLRYPVKSMRGESLQAATLSAEGVFGDRPFRSSTDTAASPPLERTLRCWDNQSLRQRRRALVDGHPVDYRRSASHHRGGRG